MPAPGCQQKHVLIEGLVFYLWVAAKEVDALSWEVVFAILTDLLADEELGLQVQQGKHVELSVPNLDGLVLSTSYQDGLVLEELIQRDKVNWALMYLFYLNQLTTYIECSIAP